MIEFSVVIPVYNRKSLIRRALESVLNQSYPSSQVVVVDDGSTDGTSDMLQLEYPQVTVIRQEHRGVSAARNKGIIYCRSDWVAFLDSDDEWHPEKLKKQALWLSENSEYRVCHCDEIWIRNGVRVNPKVKHAKSGGWIFLHCLPLCVVSPSAVVINRKVFQEVGIFDESLPVCEDYDLWLRITSKFPVGFVSEQLVVKYGGHIDQLSKAYPAMDRYRISSLIKLLESNQLRFEYQNKVIEMLVQKIQIYLNGARKRGNTAEVLTYESILSRFLTLEKV